MNEFEVGQTIKSLDFPGRTDCYIIGKIIGIDESKGLYECEVIEAISEGEIYEFPQPRFYTPYTPHPFDDIFEGGRIQEVSL